MLKDIATTPPSSIDKGEAKEKTEFYAQEIATLQDMLFAQKQHSLLVVLQGMDTSGKSTTVRDVFQFVNPMGIRIQSFKKPTDEEFAHDFLWRVHEHAPEKGYIRVFDRSHYEDVLIQRVHEWIDMDRVHQRYKHINNFEDLITEENNTLILKFYLHISKENQLEDLKERESDPTKKWKFNPSDYEERKHWDKYMEAYEDCFKYCGKKYPWTIVPADKGWYKRYVVAKTVYEALKDLDLSYPQ